MEDVANSLIGLYSFITQIVSVVNWINCMIYIPSTGCMLEERFACSW
jgi:hypothetical protein